jgi:hypothetical protein
VELFLVPGEGGDFSRACERHEVHEEILVTRLAPCDDTFLYSNGQSDVNQPLARIQIIDIDVLEHILESHLSLPIFLTIVYSTSLRSPQLVDKIRVPESKFLLLKFG